LSIRTDLAIEKTFHAQPIKGIEKSFKNGYFNTTVISVTNSVASEKINKPIGKYITLESENLTDKSMKFKEKACELADEIKSLIPEKSRNFFIVCLGNRNITPDALGAFVAENIIATRHLVGKGFEFFKNLTPVSVLCCDVMGNTGIESCEIVGSVCRKINPDCVIVIDALCCKSSHRLATTIQLSNSGISPGSGVENSRKELSYNTLKVPVIAIGVPTVMDIVLDDCRENKTMMITPKDIDKLVKSAGELIAVAINIALQPKLSFDEIVYLCE
jgi:spore protease